MIKLLVATALWLLLMFAAVGIAGPGRATAAGTELNIAELVQNANTAADHQKLVKWYEQREDEVRRQAELYRGLAQAYGGHRGSATSAACEDIAQFYDNIAEKLEKLAEQHRHFAAHGP